MIDPNSPILAHLNEWKEAKWGRVFRLFEDERAGRVHLQLQDGDLRLNKHLTAEVIRYAFDPIAIARVWVDDAIQELETACRKAQPSSD
jgi:hypothetical protein